MREPWIDRWKGLLILLVVLGHVAGSVGAMAPYAEWHVWNYVYKAIYLFHMAAFFFISGMLFKPDSPLDFIGKRFRRLVVPYLVFGVISIAAFQLLESAFKASVNGNGYWLARGGDAWWASWVSLLYGAPWPGTDGFRCNSVLWFLPCLFSAQALMLAVSRCSRWVVMAIGLASPMAFVAMNRWGCPNLPWGLSVLPKYFIFVALGHVVGANRLPGGRWSWGAIAYLVLAYFICYEEAMYVRFGWWWLVTAMGLAGIAVSAALAKVLKGGWLATLGVMSIAIMLTHKFPLLALQLKAPLLRDWIVAGGVRSGLAALGLFIGATLVSTVAGVVIKRYAPWALGMRAKNVS